jgi:heme exporter protein B
VPKAASSPVSRVWAVFAKDTRSEYRTRFAVNALLLFALVTLTALSFSVGGVGITALLAAVFFWIIVFFSALSSLAQTFVKEVETKTATFLRLTAPDDAVFFGKWGFNLVLILLLEVVLTPLFIVILDIEIVRWDVWIATALLGAVGLVSTSTLIGALIAVAGVRGALFSVLSFPVLLPLLVVLIRVTEVSFGGGVTGSLYDGFLILGAYAVITTTAGWLLFPFVWRE